MGETVLEGLVLRYGSFYGPGTTIGQDGAMVNDVRNRRMPIVGGGTGVWSFLHIDDAARFTLAALSAARPEFIMSSMILLPFRNGYLPSRRRLARNRLARSPPGSLVS